jgi:hypothetical protein
MIDRTEMIARMKALKQAKDMEKSPRCAECDCENGGADCNWIAPSNSESKEAD